MPIPFSTTFGTLPKEANQEQRNKLARQLFDEIWVKDKQVIAVKPRPELKPFFQLSYEGWLRKFELENSTPIGVAKLHILYRFALTTNTLHLHLF